MLKAPPQKLFYFYGFLTIFLLYTEFSLHAIAPVEMRGENGEIVIVSGDREPGKVSYRVQDTAQSPPLSSGAPMQEESPIFARMLIKVEELQGQLTHLVGKVEMLENQLAVHMKKMDDQMTAFQTYQRNEKSPSADINKPQGEKSPAGAGENHKPSPSQKDNKSAEELLLIELRQLSPEKAYEKARGYIPRAEYSQAARALEAFVKLHPKHTLTQPAIYWWGEAHFAQKQFAEAAKKFLDGYQQDPKGSKAPDLLLKLAISLHHLKKDAEACATFKKLFSEYPKMDAALKKVAEGHMKSLKCSG